MNEPADPRARRADLRTGCLLAAALASVAAALLAGGEHAASPALVDAPELPSPAARCEADAASAQARASVALRAAEAHMARYPFAPDEGLRALARLAEARDCLALAGERVAAADDPSTRAQQYRARIGADYRDHLTRLRRALALGDLPFARDDVAYLRALLGDGESAFSAELRSMQLELDSRASSSEVQP